MVSFKDYRVRIVVGVFLLLVGMVMTAAATYPTPTTPLYVENGTLSLQEGNPIYLPTNLSALYPYEYKGEYTLKVTFWGTGDIQLKNTYTGEVFNISLNKGGVPVTLIPPAAVEVYSKGGQTLEYSLIIYSRATVSSDLVVLIMAMVLALLGAVLGVSGVMSFITKRLGEALVRR